MQSLGSPRKKWDDKWRAKQHPLYFRARKYRLTGEALEALYIAQDHCCAICGDRPEELVVDHDHSCTHYVTSHTKCCADCVRGLLCRPCNTAIGLLREDPELFNAAGIYMLQKRNVLG
jgi:hypothetical protein